MQHYTEQQRLRYLEMKGLPPVKKATAPKKYKLVYKPTGEVMLDKSDWVLCDTMRKTYLRMSIRYSKSQFKIVPA